MADDIVEVQIRANVAGLTSGLKDAAGAVATSSQQMSASLDGVGKHSDSLSGMLRDFKSEAVSTGRTARFFANDLASIIPGADGAKSAVASLFGALLSGGTIGAAIEGIKFLAEGLKELGADERQAGEDAKKFAEDSAKSVKALNDEVAKLLFTMSGASRAQILAFEKTQPMREKDAELTKTLRDAEQNLAAAKAYANTVDAESVDIANVAVTAGEKRVKQIKDEIAANKENIAAANTAVGPLASADKAKAAQDDADASALAWAKFRADDLKEAKKHADAVTAETLRSLTDQFAGEEKYELDLAKLRADDQKENKKHYDQVTNDTLAALTEQFDAQDKAAKDAAKQQEAAANAVARTMGHAITDMLFNAKSLDDALADIGKQMASAAIQFAIRALLGGSTGGAGGFFASILGFEHGGDVPSAAGGWDVPSAMGAIPALLHPNEMVLPEKYADVIRGAAAGGGGGGAPVQVVINAINTQGVREFVSSRDFADAYQRAQRMGRIP